MNPLGQMMEYEQGTVQLDLFHLGFGQGCGQDSFTVGFAAEIANVALDHLALDSAR
jgi:hypothetical protein